MPTEDEERECICGGDIYWMVIPSHDDGGVWTHVSTDKVRCYPDSPADEGAVAEPL